MARYNTDRKIIGYTDQQVDAMSTEYRTYYKCRCCGYDGKYKVKFKDYTTY